MSFDLKTVNSAISVIGDAVADTNNALGERFDADKVRDFGNMIPAITSLAINAGALPKDVAQIEPAVVQQIQTTTAQQLGVPHDVAKTVIQQVLDLLGGIVSGIIANSQGIASLIKATRH